MGRPETGATPAEGDSVGVAAPGYRLPPATRPGAVTLQVTDLERSIGFYRDQLGFRLLEEGGGVARLGAHADDDAPALLVLAENRHARPVAPRSRLGLFHFAVLLPSREHFGRLLRHLARRGLELGASDHGVSEAVYLSDPDGLNLEIYRDRPRGDWRTRGDQLVMVTDPLDAAGAMEAGGAGPWQGLPAGTRIGHMHLHVGRLDEAERFYHDALGLDKVVWSYPGALFLSAGGYHHHLGVNTWAGHAPSPGEDEARLLEWTLVVPDAEAVEKVAESLEGAGYDVERDAASGHILSRDPWGTPMRVTPGG